ncbi:MAG: DJ-1 family protein [Planctomycetes bacterium]|nr:DJ-1 family protein [Planctomycetota bacterium]
MGKTALVAIADGIEEIEAVCIIDVLRRGGVDVTVASVGGLQIEASRGVKLVADALISDCVEKSFDLIALPGGMPGAEHLRDCPELIELLKQQNEQGKLYGAICASPAVVLLGHGLLEGKKATCHPAFAEKLGDAESAEQRVVVDGNCVTSQGPGTAIEFALVLVEKLLGKEKAESIAKPMVVK